MKKINSCLTIIAIIPRTEPIPRLPTSPIKIFAGRKLNVKKLKLHQLMQCKKILTLQNKGPMEH